MKDGIHYTSQNRSSKGTKIVKYSYETGDSVDIIFSDAMSGMEDFRIGGYEFSADESKLLISTNSKSIYRYSSTAEYWVYDRETRKTTLLSPERQMYATFSPDGEKVGFVRDNNLFYVDLASGEETQITSDGAFNSIINGASDWVYEEEFGLIRSFEWSPDSKSIAYYRFDETEVKEFSMDVFGGNLYPEQERFKYPKAGEDNSKVEIKIYHLETESTIDAQVNYEDDFYIPRIQWTNNPNYLVITTVNRLQNSLNLLKVNRASGEYTLLYSETAPSYVEIHDELYFLKDDSFIWMSEKDGHYHVYHYSSKGNLKRQITTGEYDVTSIYGIDETSNTLYYQAAAINPMDREVYKVKLKGKGNKSLSLRAGSNGAKFSDNFKYFINYHSDANTPSFVSLHTNDGKEVRVLKDNARLNATLSELNIGKKEFFSFTTSEGVELNAWMMKPADFDPSMKYPVLMYVYGGPGSQTVRNSWGGSNQMWFHMLCQKGYIVVSVDNRGTGARGRDFRTQTYKELGKYETMDQIEGARYLAGLDYIDGERIGIWGWSYGGYMTSLCLTKGASEFKTGIAVAPVTNWRYYDSIYTERYMSLPQNNAEGYDNNSPINHVDKLEGNLLLVHGSGDDNVHYQNTMEMIEALVQANKQFDLFVYPDKNHGIYGGNTRMHLYTKMTNYLLENL